MLALTQLSNYLTLKGSFSAVSKPNFASTRGGHRERIGEGRSGGKERKV